MMAQTNWEADKMLDVYIYDYLVKRNLQASAKAFQAEGKVSPDPVAIDAPGGFLFEWWSVFWDIFIARTNEKHSEVAASYIETQQLKAREQQQQQQLHLQLLQRHAQQQLQSRGINGAANSLNANAFFRHSTANAMSAKIYEERLKQSQQRDGLEDPSTKRFGELPGQLLEGNQTVLLKLASAPCQPSGQPLHVNAGGSMTNALQYTQQISASSQENKTDASTAVIQRSITDSSCFGAAGVGCKSSIINSESHLQGDNQGPTDIQRKDWPLTGLDQIRSSSLSQKHLVQSPQNQYHQLQQQLLLQAQAQAQAQGNISSSNSLILGDMDSQRFRAVMNRNPFGVRDGQLNASVDIQGMTSSFQATSLARIGQEELLMKIKMAQLQQQQQIQGSNQLQQASQQVHPSQQQQSAVLQQQQQHRIVGTSGVTLDDLPHSLRGNDQSISKGQNGRKRKQLGSCSGPANSTGTGNTTGPSPNSAPSTPSTHTPVDPMTTMAGGLQRSGSTSKQFLIYSSDGTGSLASPSNHLPDIDRFGEDGSLDDNVESFLLHEETDPREGLFSSTERSSGGNNMDVSKGFSFQEVCCLRSSNSKVVCCHFSSDGKLLANAGHDKKVVLWNMDTLKLKSTLGEHSLLITDVRFSSNSKRLATSSFDRSVRVWDADNPSFSIRSFTGHQGSVTSLDFHPSNEDLLCSCDDNNEIRYWSVNQGICTKAFKGGMKQVRFQPRAGRLLAAATENVVSILDVNSEACIHSLQGHIKPVHCVCWDATGKFLASVSDESVRVWDLGSGGPECLHELGCNGNVFHSCVFHPTYSSLLVIGCYQSLELWNMAENKSMTIPAHDCVIAGLAQSRITGMVASASHDKCVKLWK